MYTIGKLITVWQKNPSNKDYMNEILMGTEAFYEIAKELQRRSESML
jgi:hypothetical protein